MSLTSITTDRLEKLQRDVAAMLRSVSRLQYTPVILVAPRLKADGTVEAQPQQQQIYERAVKGTGLYNGRAGTVIVVQQAMEEIIDLKARGSSFLVRARLMINVEENLQINSGSNGTGLSAAALADIIFTVLHWYPFGDYQIMPEPKNTKRQYQYANGIQGVELGFFTDWLRSQSPRCERPSLSLGTAPILTESGVNITAEDNTPLVIEDGAATYHYLESETPGAAIYYTLDGEFPTVETGTLFTAGFQITESCTLRAVAVKDGLEMSPVLQVNLTLS